MRRNPPLHSLPIQERASTGVPGLDDVLGGGLPVNHVYLVEGDPGSGKTTLGLHFLQAQLENLKQPCRAGSDDDGVGLNHGRLTNQL